MISLDDYAEVEAVIASHGRCPASSEILIPNRVNTDSDFQE